MPATNDQTEAARLFALAHDHHRAGRAADAVAQYRACLSLRPETTSALIGLGVALQDIGVYEEAVQTLRRAAAAAPNSFEAHYNLGVVLSSQFRPDEAIDAYRSALAVDPRAPNALVNLGALLREKGRLDDAIGCYERAISVAPNLVEPHINLANALHDKGERARGLEALRRAIALDPANPESQTKLGERLEQAGDLAGAEAAFRRALALKPGYVDALAPLAIVLQRLGKRNEAATLLDYAAFLRTIRLADGEEGSTIAAFNAALADYVYRHPTLTRDPPGTATRVGSQTLHILHEDGAPIRQMRRFIQAAVDDYIATVVRASPRTFGPPPPRWGMQGWAVVLQSGGYQTPHFHPGGLVSGVYYVQVPDVVKSGRAGEAGCIKFGDALANLPEVTLSIPLLTEVVRPEEGLLVLFPSFFWHNTIPFESDASRICIAFDVRPLP
jgi:tetratricopeptide (TPR) repeat protein